MLTHEPCGHIAVTPRPQSICQKCHEVFHTQSALSKHIRTKHNADILKCVSCGKLFKSATRRALHESVCGLRWTHPCVVCGMRFSTREEASTHATTHNSSCVCHLCGQSFSRPSSCRQHCRNVHGNQSECMICDHCGKSFTRRSRIIEHLQRHMGQMEFTCHVCGKGNTNAYALGVHLASHSTEKPHTCRVCGRGFTHQRYLYSHQRAMHSDGTGKKTVQKRRPPKNLEQRTCPVCQKCFQRESAMLIHKRVEHDNCNAYVCKYCGKDFKYTYLLYVHKRKHHFPEQCKYSCEHCQKPFPVKKELMKHLRKHTGEKPYVCHVCGKAYAYHGSLYVHMQSQHEQSRELKCEVCELVVASRSQLTRHMVSHMPQT